MVRTGRSCSDLVRKEGSEAVDCSGVCLGQVDRAGGHSPSRGVDVCKYEAGLGP